MEQKRQLVGRLEDIPKERPTYKGPLIAHKTELYTTPEQEEYLKQNACTCRHLWNQLLAHFKSPDVKWNKYEAKKYFQDVLRKDFPWYKDAYSSSLYNIFYYDMQTAYDHFFRRLKTHKPPYGYPVFKSKDKHNKFSIRMAAAIKIYGRYIKLPKLDKPIKMRRKVRFKGTVSMASFSLHAGKWYVSLLVRIEDYPEYNQPYDSVGVDFGLSELAVLSDGTVFHSDHTLKKNLKRLKKLQIAIKTHKKNSSKREKVLGSNRRNKAKQKIARLHKRIADQRSAILHNVSDYLTKNYKVICLEDLNVKGMTKNHHVVRAINDASFGTLRRQIEYKAKLRGCQVIVIDRWEPTSKTCCACGSYHKEMVVGVELLTCDCGNVMDRDLNAAINIERAGLELLSQQ